MHSISDVNAVVFENGGGLNIILLKESMLNNILHTDTICIEKPRAGR